MTLNAAVADFGVPQFCKIDVEGFEREVFTGLDHQIPCVTFEYHGAQIAEAVWCLERLAAFGPARVNFTTLDTSTFVGPWLSPADAAVALTQTVASFDWGDVFVQALSRQTGARPTLE